MTSTGFADFSRAAVQYASVASWLTCTSAPVASGVDWLAEAAVAAEPTARKTRLRADAVAMDAAMNDCFLFTFPSLPGSGENAHNTGWFPRHLSRIRLQERDVHHLLAVSRQAERFHRDTK